MKNISLLLSLLFLLFIAYNCTEDSGLTGDKSESSTDSGFSLTDGSGKYSGSGGSSGPGTEVDPGNGGQQTTIEPGQITAAEWNDLVEWDFWLNLGQNQEFGTAKSNWNFNPSERYSFVVTDRNHNPVSDCEIWLNTRQGDQVWKARTDNEGKAELWLNLFGESNSDPVAVVKYGGENLTIADPKNFSNGVNDVILAKDRNREDVTDIAFVVDATGSMGDEIEYLKTELLDVVDRSSAINPQLSLRLGSVFYRDEGDDYLTRVSQFSTDINQTLNFIKAQNAEGGGDYEEAVHTALNTAVTQLNWSSNAKSRLLFLLLDAPPHHTDAIVSDVNDIIKDAASKGIKIIPISASGINKDTEFLFRFFALATNGTYVFITNDSGIGNEHIEATVGEYEVEMLNDLIVRLIIKYTL